MVDDAALDPRFALNPLVTEAPFIRFYGGAPLVTLEGFRIGTLCVMDRRPRTFGSAHAAALRTLARQVVAQLELRRRIHRARAMQHEVRTPMTAILGCLSLLASGTVGGLNAEAREAVAVVERNMERLKIFVEGLETS